MLNTANQKEMQLKTRRCHLTPFRLAVYKNQKVTSVDEDGEAGTLVRSQCGCKLVPLPGNRVWGFLKKSKAKLPYDEEIPPLGIYPKAKAASQRDLPTPVFTAASFTVAKRCTPKVQEWMGGKQNVVHPYNGTSFSLKQEGVLSQATTQVKPEGCSK